IGPYATRRFRDTPSLDWYVSRTKSPSGRPTLLVEILGDGAYLRVTYADETEFVIDRFGSAIFASWPDASTLEDTCVYLLGPISGLMLRLRGIPCLHAATVAVGDSAFALVGGPGAGKSTMAAAFARRGVPILADDLSALVDQGRQFLVQPGPPRLFLWP